MTGSHQAMTRPEPKVQDTPTKNRYGPALCIGLGLLLSVLTRMPLFLDGDLNLDGDESILGLMALATLKLR